MRVYLMTSCLAELQVRSITLTLHDEQYSDLTCLMDNFTAIQARTEIETRFAGLRDLHPDKDVFAPGGALAWWQYAGRCIIHLNGTRHRRWFSWASISRHCQRRREYVELFKRKRNVPWHPPLDDEGVARLAELEEALDLDDILFFRSFAETDLSEEAKRSKKMTEELATANQAAAGGGWWGAVFGGASSSSAPEATASADEIRLTEAQRRELYKTIDFNEVALEFTLRPDYVYTVFDIEVVRAAVVLIRRGSPMTRFEFDGTAKIELFQGTRLTLAVESATLYDEDTLETCFPKLLTHKPTDGASGTGSELPFLRLSVESDPVDSDADIIFKLRLRPVQLVYNHFWVQNVFKFFRPHDALSHLRGAALSWSEQRQSELLTALTNHRRIDLNISVEHPILFIPADVRQESPSMLIADLVSCNVISLRGLANIADECLFGKPPEPRSAYDAFMLDVHGASLSLCESAQSSGAADGHPPPVYRLFDRTSCLLGLFTCIDRQSTTLTKLVVNGSIPKLVLHVAGPNLLVLSRLLSSITAKQQDVAATTAPVDTGSVNVSLYQLTADAAAAEAAAAESHDSRHLVDCAFSIEHITIELSNTVQRVAQLDAVGLSVSFYHAHVCSHSEAHLTSLCITDLLSSTSPRFSELASSSSGGNQVDLINIQIDRFPRTSPLFQGVTQHVHVSLNDLSVNWNADTIATIAAVARLPETDVVGQYDDVSDVPLSLVPDTSATSPKVADLVVAPFDSRSLVIEVTLRRVRLSLNKETRDRVVAVALVSDLVAEVVFRREWTSVVGDLGSFDLAMPLPENGDLTLLGLRDAVEQDRDHQLLHFEADIFGPDVIPAREHSTRFALSVASVRAVYLHQPTMELVDYLFQGILGTFLAQTVANATDALRPTSRDETPASKYLLLELDISRPLVMVPTHASASAKRLEIDLGQIAVRSSPGTCAGDLSIFVNATNMSVCKGDSRHVISHADLHVTVDMPCKPVDYDIFVRGQLSNLEVTLAKETYLLAMQIFYSNIAAPAAVISNAKSIVAFSYDDVNVLGSRLNVKFDVPEVRFLLLAGCSVDWVSDSGSRLALLSARDICIRFLSVPPRHMEFGVSLSTVTMEDERVASCDSPFRTLIGDFSAAKTDDSVQIDEAKTAVSHVAVEWVQPRSASEPTTLSVVLHSPCGYAVSSFLYDLGSFFSLDGIAPSVTADHAVLQEDPSTTSSSSTVIRIEQSRMVFLEDLKASDSRAIATSCDFVLEVLYEGPSYVSTSIDVLGLQMFSCTADRPIVSKDGDNSVMSPFNVNVVFSADGTTTVRLQPVRLHISVEIARLFSNILFCFLENYKPNVIPVSAGPDPAVGTPTTKGDLAVNIDDIILLFLDEHSKKHLLDARLSNLAFRKVADQQSNTNRISASSTVIIQHYVGGAWNEVIEPWPLSLQLVMPMLPGRQELCVSSGHVLRLVLYKSFVRRSVSLLSSWMDFYYSLPVAQGGQSDAIASVAGDDDYAFDCTVNVAGVDVMFRQMSTSLPIVNILASEFSFEMHHAKTETKQIARLRSLHIRDLLQPSGDAFADLARSDISDGDNSNDLIRIVRDVGAEGTHLDISFSSLYIQWNPDTVSTVMQILEADSTEAVSSPSHRSEVPVPVPNASNDSASSKFQLTSQLRRVVVTFNKERKGIALFQAQLDNLAIKMESCDAQLGTTVSLSSLSARVTRRASSPIPILDLSQPDSSRPALSVCYGTVDSLGNSSLTITLAPLRLVYLQQTILEAVDYLTAGVLGAVLSHAVAKTADVVSVAVAITVDAESPTVVVPVIAGSRDFLLANASALSFSSSSPEKFNVAVQRMNIRSVVLDDELEIGSVDFHVDICIPVDNSRMTVQCSIPSIECSLSHDQYLLILAVFAHNFSSMSTVFDDDLSMEVPRIVESVSTTVPVSYAFEQQDAPSRPMTILLEVSNICLRCVGATSRLSSLDKFNDASLATLVIGETRFSYNRDSSFHLKLTMRSIEIQDSRSRLSHAAFRKMLTTTADDATSSVVNFDMDSTTTSLTILHPSIFFLPQLAFDLVRFFDSSESVYSPATNGARASGSQVSAQPAAPSSSTRFVISVSESRIVFVEDIVRTDSRLIVTRSSFSFTISDEVSEDESGGQRDTKLLLSGIESFIGQEPSLSLQQKTTRLPMLEPTNFALHLNDIFTRANIARDTGPALRSRDLRVQFDPVSLVVSYEDFCLLGHVIASITRAASRGRSSVTASRISSARSSLDSTSSISEVATDDEIKSGVDTVDVRGSDVVLNNVAPVTYAANVSFDQVKCIAVNDCRQRYMPLLSARTTPFKLLVSGGATHVRALASLAVSVYAFNPSITTWEPVLEPCAFEVNMQHMLAAPATQPAPASSETGSKSLMRSGSATSRRRTSSVGRKGSVSSQRRTSTDPNRHVTTAIAVEVASASNTDEFLNINVSSAVIETLLGTWQLWQQQRQRPSMVPGNDAISVFAPYFVRNETGGTVEFWLDTDSSIRGTVADGCEAPVEIIPQELLHSSARVSWSLTLQVSGPYQPIFQVKFDRVGISRFALRPSKRGSSTTTPSSRPIYLISECRLRNGFKSLLLRSPIVIVNKLNVDVDVVACDQGGVGANEILSSNRFGPIRPGQSLPVPLRHLHCEHFFVRPLSDDQSWSRKPLSVSSLASAENKTHTDELVCGPAGRFRLFVHGYFERYHNPLRGATITLLSPFVFENLLGKRLSYAIKYREGGVVSAGSVQPGSIAHFCDFDSSRDPFIAITVDHFQPLRWVRICPGAGSPDDAAPAYLASGSTDSTSWKETCEEHVILTDVTGSPMRARIDCLSGSTAISRSSGPAARVVVSISASFILADSTGFGLEFGWVSSPDTAPHRIPAQVALPLVAEVYENQVRTSPTSRWMPAQDLPWSDVAIRFPLRKDDDRAHLPDSFQKWTWLDADWNCDKESSLNDAEGWVYAVGRADLLKTPHRQCTSLDLARRRRWFRRRTAPSTLPLCVFGLLPGRVCDLVVRANGSSQWSPPFNLTASVDDGAIHVIDPTGRRIDLGVQFDVGPAPFRLSKLAQFVPRHVVANNTNETVYVAQPSSPASLLAVAPHTCEPLIWAPSNATQRLVSISTDLVYWSGYFYIHEVSEAVLKVVPSDRRASGSQSSHQAVPSANLPTADLFDLHIQAVRATIFAFIAKRDPARPPYVIQNQSSYGVVFRQHLVSPFTPGPLIFVEPGASVPFAWDCLAAPRPLRLELRTDVWFGTVEMDDLGLDTCVGPPTAMLRVRMVTRRQAKVLQLQDMTEARQQQYRRRHQFEQRFVDLDFMLIVPRICVSVIDDRPAEIALLTMDGMEFFVQKTAAECHLELQVVSAQLDNLDDGEAPYRFPVAVSPATLKQSTSSTSSTAARPPHILVRSCILLDRASIRFLKYFGVLVQETIVDVDEDFLSLVSDFATRSTQLKTWDMDEATASAGAITVTAREPDETALAVVLRLQRLHRTEELSEIRGAAGSLMYFNTLELAPIHIRFSFASSSSSGGNRFGTAFKNVDDAPIRLEGKLMKNVFVTFDVLLSHLAAHYHASVMDRVFLILGSVSVLGNPIGLLHNLGSGLSDFFNDPMEGLVEGNLLGFGQGLKKGSQSLLNQSLYGVGNSLAGISGNLGSGVAAIGTNEEYRSRRAQARARENPDDVLEGLVYGTRNLATGIADGISGVFMDPLKGATTSGVGGFFKGSTLPRSPVVVPTDGPVQGLHTGRSAW